jgi:outer membrane protein
VNRSKLAVLVGALCAVVFAFSMVSTAMAAEDFQRWSLSTQIMYLDVDLSSSDVDALGYGKLGAEDAMTGGLVVEYFFTPNISAELVAAVAHLDLDLGGEEVANGEAWVLPPSLYVKYHPMPQWKISPYVGVGVNWMFFWDEGLYVNALDTDADLSIDASFGWNAKIGADIKITENLYANVDIMYLDNETEIDTAVARNADVDVEVLSYNVGLKYRF